MPYSNQKMPTSGDLRTLLDGVTSIGCSVHDFEKMPDFRCGCWSLIIRHGSILLRFFWDGRDDLLTVEETDYDPDAKQFLWHPTDVPRVEVDDAREPFRYIEEVLKKKYRLNENTGANAGGPPQSPIRTRWAARIAQFFRSTM